MKQIELIDVDMMWCDVENAYIDANGIQKLLVQFGSWLKEFKVNDRPFNEWIFEVTTNAGIEPIMTLAMLQKESSLVQKYSTRPKDKVLDYCLGFGCPENGTRNPNYQGFEKQINSMIDAFSNKYLKWNEIINYASTPIYLYDTKEKVLAGNKETALHLLYNPRYEGVKLLKDIWDRYYSICDKLNILNA